MTTPAWDVAIVGGGPAGCATALALAARGVERVCIVDAGQAGTGRRIGESIPPDTRLLLEELGAWSAFTAGGHEPCLGSCAAWGSDVLGYNDFLFSGLGHGWHLDRAGFERQLLDLAQVRGTHVVTQTRVEGVMTGDGQSSVLGLRSRAGGPSTLAARIIVDATGSRAAMGRLVGATPIVVDRLVVAYGFFVAARATSSSRLTVAETVEDGWWYAAAIPGDRIAVAFATDRETAQALGISEPDRWLARALRTRHLATRLDGCRFEADGIVMRAAPVARLDDAAGRRWLAVGDAAAAYDPLASAGIHKALADGIDAGAAIARALEWDGGLDDGYARASRDAFDHHLASRNHFYQQEQRWPQAPFWSRRHAIGDADSQSADSGRERAAVSLAQPAR